MDKEPSKSIDLRSDTVTQPCKSMRKAMAEACVGDDVNGDDPTVIRLQQKVAELLGKEAGLFLPSGTMSNAVAVRTHTQPGDEIVTEEESHLYVYEGGGYAAISGCSMALVPSVHGIMDPDDVRKKIRKSEGSRGHYPNASLVCVENTSNRGGGTCYPKEILDQIFSIAKECECKLHLDGARFFNAVQATELSPAKIAEGFDSISVCLSKGLGAPVGSVLIGSKKFIGEAHRWRKMLGGGMRQSGILAEAGIYALDHNLARLEDDHRRALTLATAIAGLDGLSIKLDTVQTNMIYVKTRENAENWESKLRGRFLLCFALNENILRLVTHLGIGDEDIAKAIGIFTELSKE